MRPDVNVVGAGAVVSVDPPGAASAEPGERVTIVLDAGALASPVDGRHLVVEGLEGGPVAVHIGSVASVAGQVTVRGWAAGRAETEVAHAWENAIKSRQRHGEDDPSIWIAIGILPDGRFAELVAFMDAEGAWCVFHAMTPPTKKFKRELGLGKEGTWHR